MVAVKNQYEKTIYDLTANLNEIVDIEMSLNQIESRIEQSVEESRVVVTSAECRKLQKKLGKLLKHPEKIDFEKPLYDYSSESENASVVSETNDYEAVISENDDDDIVIVKEVIDLSD